MLTVTEGAKQLLKETLLAYSDDSAAGLRLSMKPPGQLGIVLDREAEGDQVVEHEGAKVLLIAADLVPVVDGKTLGVEDSAEGQKLVISSE